MMTPFYKAVVLSSLIYRSETWTITRKIYQNIDLFHHTETRKTAVLPITYNREKMKMDIPIDRKTALSLVSSLSGRLPQTRERFPHMRDCKKWGKNKT